MERVGGFAVAAAARMQRSSQRRRDRKGDPGPAGQVQGRYTRRHSAAAKAFSSDQRCAATALASAPVARSTVALYACTCICMLGVCVYGAGGALTRTLPAEFFAAIVRTELGHIDWSDRGSATKLRPLTEFLCLRPSDIGVNDLPRPPPFFVSVFAPTQSHVDAFLAARCCHICSNDFAETSARAKAAAQEAAQAAAAALFGGPGGG